MGNWKALPFCMLQRKDRLLRHHQMESNPLMQMSFIVVCQNHHINNILVLNRIQATLHRSTGSVSRNQNTSPEVRIFIRIPKSICSYKQFEFVWSWKILPLRGSRHTTQKTRDNARPMERSNNISDSSNWNNKQISVCGYWMLKINNANILESFRIPTVDWTRYNSIRGKFIISQNSQVNWTGCVLLWKQKGCSSVTKICFLSGFLIGRTRAVYSAKGLLLSFDALYLNHLPFYRPFLSKYPLGAFEKTKLAICKRHHLQSTRMSSVLDGFQEPLIEIIFQHTNIQTYLSRAVLAASKFRRIASIS